MLQGGSEPERKQRGICCIADRRFMRGETLMLKIEAVKPAFETRQQ